MQATFEISGWDEKPVSEWDGGKLTHAAITKTYAGDIEGEAVLEYVLAYRSDGTAGFVGIERITGKAGDREGGLVLRQVGEFADGAAKATLTVIGGMGGFERANGEGDLVADPSGRVTLDLSTGG
jgi:hypothetical protein